MKILLSRFLPVLFIVLLSACSAKNDGHEFVGKWEPATASNKLSFEIDKTGDAYLLTDNTNAKFPGTYDPQTHILNFSMPLIGQVPFSYDASTHKVLAMGDEYQKASNISSKAKNASQDAAPVNKLDTEALAFGKGLITPHLTICDGRTLAMLSTGDSYSAPYLAEIKNPTYDVDADQITSANELNSIDFKGSVHLKWSAYKLLQHGRWTNWLDLGDIPPGGGSPQNLEQVYILHKNGQWMHDDGYYGQHDFAGLRRKPISCDALPKS